MMHSLVCVRVGTPDKPMANLLKQHPESVDGNSINDITTKLAKWKDTYKSI